MRVTLVISSLGCGGAQRVMSIMANYWAEKGWTVMLITFDNGSESPFFKLHGNVRWVPLAMAAPSGNLAQAAWNNLKRIVILRRAVRLGQPDNVISFMDGANVLTLFATIGCRCAVI